MDYLSWVICIIIYFKLCVLFQQIMQDEVSETENIRKNLAIERMIVEGCDILLDVNQTFVRQGEFTFMSRQSLWCHIDGTMMVLWWNFVSRLWYYLYFNLFECHCIDMHLFWDMQYNSYYIFFVFSKSWCSYSIAIT